MMLDTALPLNQPTYTSPPVASTRSASSTASCPLANSGLDAYNFNNPALNSGESDFSAVTETGMTDNSGKQDKDKGLL
jgi:hypothetical protein